MCFAICNEHTMNENTAYQDSTSGRMISASHWGYHKLTNHRLPMCSWQCVTDETSMEIPRVGTSHRFQMRYHNISQMLHAGNIYLHSGFELRILIVVVSFGILIYPSQGEAIWSTLNGQATHGAATDAEAEPIPMDESTHLGNLLRLVVFVVGSWANPSNDS